MNRRREKAMIKIKTTPNLYGVTLMGDYEDLDKLYDSISNYLSFYIDNADYYPYHEYEYLLSLNYDIRHCYMGDRGYEIVDNNSERYGSMAGVIFEPTEEFREEIRNVRGTHKKGNLYYTVEILYPLIFHYLIAFEEILLDEPDESWLEKESEFGGKWGERYSMIDAKRDRAAISNLIGLFWDNMQELFGRDTAKNIYDYFNEVEYTLPSSMYCDALIHCQLVNFPDMSREEKLEFLLASIYEIIDVDNLTTYPKDYEPSTSEYRNAVESLNKNGTPRFPVKEDFYDALDKVYDPQKPFYREDFDRFLNETYGEYQDPFESGEFEW